MRRILSALFLIAIIIAPGWAFASGLCCQLSSGVQEILLGAAAPAEGRLAVQITYSHTLMDEFREGSSKRSLEQLKADGRYPILPVKMEMDKYTLSMGYGVSPRLKVLVNVPYIRNTMTMQKLMAMGMMTEWMEHEMEPVEGLGDIAVIGLYRLYMDREVRPTATFSAGFGIKTPTGEYKEKTSSGRFVHAHMQAGTGSWDPILSLVYTKMAGSLLMQADVTYQLATRNDEGYKFGNSFAANLAAKYAVSESFNLSGGLIYLQTGEASDEEGKYTNLASLMDDPANTGGKSVWASAGVEILPVKAMSLDLRAQFPVWEKVNGVQLVSDYRILMGVGYRF